MKTTIQSPANSVGTSAKSESSALSKTQVEYVAIAVAAIGVLMMTNAPEDSLLKPMIGCAMIFVAVAIQLRNNKRKGGSR